MKKYLFLITVLSFISSCSSNLEDKNNLIPTLSNSYATTSPTSTETLTYLTPIPTPTKLSQEEALQFMEELIKEKKECILPCLWGVIPGETTWLEVEEVFFPISEIIKFQNVNEIYTYQVCIPFCNSGEQAQRYITYIYVKNELVIGISTNTEEINSELKTSMSSILNAFGEPEEIWIRPIRETIDNQPYYDLAVYYKNKGIVIIFNENAEKNNNFLKICPQQLFTRTPYHIIPLLLLDKTMQLEFTEIESKILGKPGFWNAEEYLPLEKVAINLTNKEFFEIYLQPNTSICFDVNPVR